MKFHLFPLCMAAIISGCSSPISTECMYKAEIFPSISPVNYKLEIFVNNTNEGTIYFDVLGKNGKTLYRYKNSTDSIDKSICNDIYHMLNYKYAEIDRREFVLDSTNIEIKLKYNGINKFYRSSNIYLVGPESKKTDKLLEYSYILSSKFVPSDFRPTDAAWQGLPKEIERIVELR